MRQKILDDVYMILKQTLNFENVHFYLFGSWAKGEEKVSSDIDIGICYEKELPVGLLAKLREAFEESTIPYHIDIVDLTKTDAMFRNKVIKEGILWSDCSKG